MNGILLKNPRAPAQMDPIGQSEFDQIVKMAQKPQPWERAPKAIIRGSIDIAAISLMRDGLLRIGETVNARWPHIQRDPDGSGRLTIPKSKVDQTGKSDVVFVSPQTTAALDAMLKNKNALGIDTATDDRIFQMSKGALYKHIQKVCLLAGLTGRYAGHSPRIGMAQDLLAEGYSLAAIMLAGRWKHTSMPAYYTRNIAVGRGAVAQYHQRDPTGGQIKSNPLGSYGIIPRHTGARFGT